MLPDPIAELSHSLGRFTAICQLSFPRQYLSEWNNSPPLQYFLKLFTIIEGKKRGSGEGKEQETKKEERDKKDMKREKDNKRIHEERKGNSKVRNKNAIVGKEKWKEA
jgi:hypothetical protein